MANLEYGTVEFYAEQFADILADVQSDEPVTGNNIVEGFIRALEDWKKYHQEQVYEYERIGERVRSALPL